VGRKHQIKFAGLCKLRVNWLTRI